MEVYFRELIRGVDASLLEEWERLKNPDWIAPDHANSDKPARPLSFDITRDAAAFKRLIRTEIFSILQRALSWDEEHEKICYEFAQYGEARGRFRLDPEGRATKHTHFGVIVSEGEIATASVGEMEVAHVLVDADGANDWEAVFGVSVAASRTENRAVVRLITVRPIGGAQSKVSPIM
jgi:hypothetical protein